MDMRQETVYVIWLRNIRERDSLEDLDMGRRIILKINFKN